MHTEKWSRGLCIWIYTLDSGPQNRHRGANRDDEFRRKETTLYQSLRKRTGRVAPSAGEALELSRSCSFASLGPENLTEYAIRRTKAGEAESIAGLFGIWRSKYWDVAIPKEGAVAQLVEHECEVLGVSGSSPDCTTAQRSNIAPLVSDNRRFFFGSDSCRFGRLMSSIQAGSLIGKTRASNPLRCAFESCPACYA